MEKINTRINNSKDGLRSIGSDLPRFRSKNIDVWSCDVTCILRVIDKIGIQNTRVEKIPLIT